MSTYDDILEQAQRLSMSEKARLLADLSAVLQRELSAPKTRKRSLLGLWEGLDLSEEALDQARQAMWGQFPREDAE